MNRSDPGRKALARLLKSAETWWAKGKVGRVPSLAFTQASFPDYFELPTHEALEALHETLQHAQRREAITIDWDPRAGDQRQIRRIVLADENALADCLGVEPKWAMVHSAEPKVAPFLGHETVRRIWDVWSQGGKVRNTGPEDVDRLVAALRVLEACEGRDETPVRRLSARLFADSKYVEHNLHALLDELTRGEDDPPVSQAEDVLRRIGLIKHPQPLLIAGQGTIMLTGNRKVSLAQPYLGIAPDAFEGMRFDGSPCQDVLTIENLTTFNEAARQMTGATPALILYTGGVPAPSWRRAYAALAGSLPAWVRFWHWGDIDEGGFRIASMIAALLPEGRTLQPWLMSPTEVAEAAQPCTTSSTVNAMIRYAKMTGWDALAREIEREPVTIEQEVLMPRLPF